MHRHLRLFRILLVAITSAACEDGSVSVEKKGGDISSMTYTGQDGKKMTMDMRVAQCPPAMRRTSQYTRTPKLSCRR
ncbi:MAG: hypothetical protein ABIZ80_26230, partial [Bryobacteraceae bacterium]